jgi:lysophospholipid acyltransferase (LPLAT)-like uncharacterized protein
MAIAVMPDGPPGRWERIGLALVALAAFVVVALLVAFVLVEFVV